MASLYLEGGVCSLSWQITGLSSSFNQTSGYALAGITTYTMTAMTYDLDHSGDIDLITTGEIINSQCGKHTEG